MRHVDFRNSLDGDHHPHVAFQGERGAFSELAMRQGWPDGADPLPCATFEGALEMLLSGAADFALLPVENTIAGPVHESLSALDAARDRLKRINEFRVRVELCLLALPGVNIETLRVVRSHPVAFAQCRQYFARMPWISVEPHFDTAGAALEVARGVDRTVGAVASEAAAMQYQLDILARNIEDVSDNWTRFVVVERR